jgi:hypothetical protein
MKKVGLSTSKVCCSRLKKKDSNTDKTIVSELVNDTNSNQYEDGESDEIFGDFEYSSTSGSEVELAPVQPQQRILIRDNYWKRNVVKVNRSIFSWLQGINLNLHLSQYCSPVGTFHLFFQH